MKISLFDSIYSSKAMPEDAAWQDVVEFLRDHPRDCWPSKDRVPAFSATSYVANTRTQPEFVCAAVIDVDKQPWAAVQRLLISLRGYAAVVYTTWSHGSVWRQQALWCLRVVVPLVRPVSAEQWPAVWPRIAAALGGVADPQCKDPGRLYYLPSCPPTEVEDAHLWILEGVSLDPSDLPEVPLQAVEQATPQTPQVPAVRGDLMGAARRLLSRASPYHRALGAAIRLAAQGEPFAEKGDRNDLAYKVAGALAEMLPEATPESLGVLFAPSLQLMGEPTQQAFVDQVRRHQAQGTQVHAEKKQQRSSDLQIRIRAAFLSDRDTPYTAQEIAALAEQHNCTQEELSRQWIVQYQRAYYLLSPLGYRGPQTPESVAVAAMRDLAPASAAQVELFRASKQGPVLKTPGELMQAYGSVADRAVTSLLVQRSTFERGVFTEAVCPLRPLKAEYSEAVAKWLCFLGAQHESTLLDWLSIATALEDPCAALYLDGAPGTGKTLLADGLARLWTTAHPTPLSQAMGGFNEVLTQCPLVLADEMIPKDYKGQPRTEELRQFIQERTRPLRRKYLSATPLEGATRVIITSNNRELLTSYQNLSPEDIQAITERLIYIECPVDARRFLQSLGTKHVRAFVEDDEIAKHALWLRDNRKVERGGRFYVEGKDSRLLRQLTVGTGLRSAVCHWLVSYLLSPRKLDSTGDRLVFVCDGSLYACARGLSQRWASYETHEKAPSIARLGRALQGLSACRIKSTAGDGRRTYYWQLDTENLISWATQVGYATRESLDSALGRS